MQLLSHGIALYKLFRIGLHVVRGLWIVYLRLPKMDQSQQEATVVKWSQQLLACFGIATHVKGAPQTDKPTLLAANHISWLDIEVLHATVFCRFVAKSEIQHWPLLGTLASSAQTIYIQRGNRENALSIVAQISVALQQENAPPIAIFPEGTTSDGTQLLPFQRRLFQAAIDARAWVQPVSLTFLDRAHRTLTTACAYIGDENLLQSIWRTLRSAPILAVVEFCSPLQATAYGSTRDLAIACQEAVAVSRSLYTAPETSRTPTSNGQTS